MSLRIEVVYALAQKQTCVSLKLPEGSTALDALLASGLPGEPRGAQPAHIGIWGKEVAPQTALHDGDRVEIYRPLVVDPRQARRERAAIRTKSSGRS